MGILVPLSFYPEVKKFADVYNKKIDPNEELAKTKDIVIGLITNALREVEKRDDVVHEARSGFPQTLVQNCLVNLLRARLHDATKDCYWHVNENSPVSYNGQNQGVRMWIISN